MAYCCARTTSTKHAMSNLSATALPPPPCANVFPAHKQRYLFTTSWLCWKIFLKNAGISGTIYNSVSAQYSDREPPFFVIDLPDQDTQIVSSTQRGATTLIIKGRKPIEELTCDLDMHELKIKLGDSARHVDLRDVEGWKMRVLSFVNTPLEDLPQQPATRFRWHENPEAINILINAFLDYKAQHGKRPTNHSGLISDPRTHEPLSTWEGAYLALRRDEITGLAGVHTLKALDEFIETRRAGAQNERAAHYAAL